MNNTRILITGSTGMAGSSIIKHLLAKYTDTRVRAAYHKTSPFIKSRRIEYVRSEMTKIKDCRKAAKGCDLAIMTCAITGGTGYTSSYPWDYIRENLLMNMRQLEAFQTEDIKRIIYIGSAAGYQEFNGRIKEEQLNLNKDPASGHPGFGWVVRFTEKLCELCREKYGMGLTVARTANIFGPYDKFDPQRSNFIPALIRKAADKMDPFQVWGSPDVCRDVIYADDFARAVVMMAEQQHDGFEIYNIGSGKKTSVADVVKWALKYSGHAPSRIEYTNKGKSATLYRVLDCSKARRILGWQTAYSPEEGIKLTHEWWLKNKDWWKK